VLLTDQANIALGYVARPALPCREYCHGRW